MSEGSDARRDSSKIPRDRGVPPEETPEEPTGTVQERVFDLYNSSSLFEVAIGFWLKFFFEGVVVALPLVLLVLFPAWILTWLDLAPVTYLEGVTVWLSLSTTILLGVWCFSEPATSGRKDR